MTTDKADGGRDLDLEGEVGGVLAQVDVLAADQRFTLSCSREMALLALMERTGYNIVQENGQRKYGGPPPGWEGAPPPRGCEIFVGKLPRDIYEDELVPLFETAGNIYEFRLMMEFSGDNRGYAFVMYTNRDDAHRAIAMLDNFEVRPGKFIGVCVSLDNCRLFIGSIPRDKKKDEILEEMRKVTDGVRDVIMYPSSTDNSRNRGFAFVEYESHKAAAMARRKLIPGSFLLWGQTIQVDWAEPERDVDEKVLQRVKVLYVRNLMLSTTDETLLHEFSRFKPGCVERIKKLLDYAFIHYRCREDAEEALRLMNGALIDGATVEVMLAKPAGVKERNSKRNNGRGYLRSGIPAGGGAVDRGLPLRSHVGSPVSSLAGGNADSCVFPLLPGTPLAPTSLLALKLSQISSAVALLDFYCHKQCWSPPEYQLYSTPDQDGTPLLLYKVVIPSTQSTFIPDKLCVLLNDAKEVAAQNALWNLDSSLMNEASSEPPGSPSPPLSISSSSPSPPGLVVCGSRSFTSCPPLPTPPVASVLSPLSTFTPPASQPQRLFFSPPSLFY